MKTVTDLRRALKVGVTVDVVNHLHPTLTGKRTVVKAQSRKLCLSFPEGHPKRADGRGSWLDWPMARDCVFEGDTVTITYANGDERKPFLTITVNP